MHVYVCIVFPLALLSDVYYSYVVMTVVCCDDCRIIVLSVFMFYAMWYATNMKLQSSFA